MSSIARLIDANANRARESLRVMEDAARFVLDDAALTEQLKSLRHALRESLDQFPLGWLEANRNTPGDVGTHIGAPHEMERENFADVVIAAGKRLSEALRSIEEAAKTVDPSIASEVESARYRAYEIERLLHAKLGSGRASQWSLCLLLTESICKQPWREVLVGAIEGGVDCVQVREKEMDGGSLAERVREVVRIARAHTRHVSIIVNDRVDVAMATGADGVHLGTGDLLISDARRLVGRTLIIGASTHDLEEANAAVEAGADYCGVGAMFVSGIKPDRAPSGARYLREFLDRHPRVPHLAIGGITTENISRVINAGAQGVAVSTAICGADDPREAACVLRAGVEAACGVTRDCSVGSPKRSRPMDDHPAGHRDGRTDHRRGDIEP